MKRGADWLIEIQNPDGGWGENCDSYKLDYKGYEPAPSTASQTAWALLGLMAAGAGGSSGGGARRLAWLFAQPGSRTGCGSRRIIPAAAFRASSTSIITAIRNSSRSGRWRATAISRAAIPGASEFGLVTILAVTGLKREAEIAGGPGVVAVAGGGDAAWPGAQAGRPAWRHHRRDFHRPGRGAVAASESGRCGDRRADSFWRRDTWRCDNLWRVALAAKMPGAHQGPIAGSEIILQDSRGQSRALQCQRRAWRWIWKARSRPALPPRAGSSWRRCG